MTKVIYINWNDHVVIASAEDKEQWVNDWIDDNGLIYDFNEWLESYHDIIEIYQMTAEEKAELPTRYEEYFKNEKDIYRRKAEERFKKNFEEIGIEVSGYAG